MVVATFPIYPVNEPNDDGFEEPFDEDEDDHELEQKEPDMSSIEPSEKPFKGKITNAVFVRVGSVYCLHGISDGHPAYHGQPIRTSYVMKMDFTVDPPVAETKNSLYEVILGA